MPDEEMQIVNLDDTQPSADEQQIKTAETWDRHGGRKNTKIAVHNRRIGLSEKMAEGMSYHKIAEWYLDAYGGEDGVGEPQLRKDMTMVRNEWKLIVFKNSFEDTLADAMARIKKSYEVAFNTKQPSAMQSAVIQELKILGIYAQHKNEIDGKDTTIQYEILNPSPPVDDKRTAVVDGKVGNVTVDMTSKVNEGDDKCQKST